MNPIFAQGFRAKKPLLGMIVYSASAIVVETIAYSGIDFVFVDTEHSPVGWESLEHMIRAAELGQVGVVVRVTENNPSLIRKAFEAGADCVCVPHVASRKDAEQAVKSARFFPKGFRGATSFARSAKYSANWATYLNETNENTLVMAMIEEQEALDKIDEIASTEGLAALNFGPLDYSVSIGVVNSPERSVKTKAAQRLISKAATKNSLALMASLPLVKEDFDELITLGYNAFLLGYDVAALRKFAVDGVNKFKSLLKENIQQS
jgi:4-hydroxy-2-oxoheptanedioate aldolase